MGRKAGGFVKCPLFVLLIFLNFSSSSFCPSCLPSLPKPSSPHPRLAVSHCSHPSFLLLFLCVSFLPSFPPFGFPESVGEGWEGGPEWPSGWVGWGGAVGLSPSAPTPLTRRGTCLVPPREGAQAWLKACSVCAAGRRALMGKLLEEQGWGWEGGKANADIYYRQIL